ncbi:hypothetical protein H920_11159 [Fukomys damarensis]|uniref:Uncharacterized protein n=1 Tax=Fukomys damarensis TaxID=885580 RepID=A0A091DB06_FUKDA|nr:hypothetical protein H920_11159 [Fukomys damarensis]
MAAPASAKKTLSAAHQRVLYSALLLPACGARSPFLSELYPRSVGSRQGRVSIALACTRAPPRGVASIRGRGPAVATAAISEPDEGIGQLRDWTVAAGAHLTGTSGWAASPPLSLSLR